MTIDMVSIAPGIMLGLTGDWEAQLDLGGMPWGVGREVPAEKPRAVFEKLGVASSDGRESFRELVHGEINENQEVWVETV